MESVITSVDTSLAAVDFSILSLFIKLYYKYGSYLANIIDKSESAKSVVRKVLLTPLVNYSRRKIKETSKSD